MKIRRCGDCGRCYIPAAAYTRPSAADKEQGLALHGEGVSLSAIARTFGVTPQAVSRWVKKGGRPHGPDCGRRGEQRTADPAGRQPAVVIAFDEMWTYQQARHGDQRQDLWIWTAVVEEPDGRRWADFEVGDRSENTFQKL